MAGIATEATGEIIGTVSGVVVAEAAEELGVELAEELATQAERPIVNSLRRAAWQGLKRIAWKAIDWGYEAAVQAADESYSESFTALRDAAREKAAAVAAAIAADDGEQAISEAAQEAGEAIDEAAEADAEAAEAGDTGAKKPDQPPDTPEEAEARQQYIQRMRRTVRFLRWRFNAPSFWPQRMLLNGNLMWRPFIGFLDMPMEYVPRLMRYYMHWMMVIMVAQVIASAAKKTGNRIFQEIMALLSLSPTTGWSQIPFLTPVIDATAGVMTLSQITTDTILGLLGAGIYAGVVSRKKNGWRALLQPFIKAPGAAPDNGLVWVTGPPKINDIGMTDNVYFAMDLFELEPNGQIGPQARLFPSDSTLGQPTLVGVTRLSFDSMPANFKITAITGQCIVVTGSGENVYTQLLIVTKSYVDTSGRGVVELSLANPTLPDPNTVIIGAPPPEDPDAYHGGGHGPVVNPHLPVPVEQAAQYQCTLVCVLTVLNPDGTNSYFPGTGVTWLVRQGTVA